MGNFVSCLWLEYGTKWEIYSYTWKKKAKGETDIMGIEHVVCISSSLLLVYRTNQKDYRYEIYFWDGSFYQPNELYQTSHQALVIGTESIKIVMGY